MDRNLVGNVLVLLVVLDGPIAPTGFLSTSFVAIVEREPRASCSPLELATGASGSHPLGSGSASLGPSLLGAALHRLLSRNRSVDG
jgi:hypothetical protein